MLFLFHVKGKRVAESKWLGEGQGVNTESESECRNRIPDSQGASNSKINVSLGGKT